MNIKENKEAKKKHRFEAEEDGIIGYGSNERQAMNDLHFRSHQERKKKLKEKKNDK